MFTVTRSYNSYALPVPVLYVDSVNVSYTFDNLTFQATDSNDTLTLEGATNVAIFNGDAFPLAGSSYAAAVTGTLSITVTQSLSTGLHLLYFYNTNPTSGLLGLGLLGISGLATGSTVKRPLETKIQVQAFTLPLAVIARYAPTGRTPIADPY